MTDRAVLKGIEMEKEKQQEKQKEEIRVHRVGSVTFGLVLITFGVLFLLHMFFPFIDYIMVFHLWPCVFITLGIEVLLSTGISNIKCVYDKTAIFLMLLLVLFAMTMGGMDFIMEHYGELYQAGNIMQLLM